MSKSKEKRLKRLAYEKRLLSAIAPEYISIGAYADYSEYGEVPSRSLTQLFSIKEEELNAFGILFSKKNKSDEKYCELIDSLALITNGYQQFQDLMDLSFSSIDDIKKVNEQFFHRNYLYYESLVYLRSIVVSILNVNVLGALTLLRPYSELSIFFLYYRYVCEKKGLDKLYGWMKGENGKPPFADALKYVTNEQCDKYPELSDIINTQLETIEHSYKELSAYNHTPRVNESIGQLSGGYGPSNLQDIYYAIICTISIVHALCVLFTIARPMILFPVNEVKRFGFSGPVGIFSDFMNNAIVEKSLKEETVKKLKACLGTSEDVKGVIDFYESKADLSEDKIRDSYHLSENENIEIIRKCSINDLAARKKAHIRALSWFMNYVSQKDVNATI